VRYAFCLTTLLFAVILAQLALAPAFLPPVLQPDIGILVAMALLAMGPREFGLVAVFAFGLQADLFGSARFGLLTLSYLLAAGVMLLTAWRELTRGDLLSAWGAGVVGTLLAHLFYVLIGRLFGLHFAWGQASAVLTSFLVAALVWGLPCALIVGRWMLWTRTLTPAIREKWLNAARLNAMRKGKLRRA
jgi:hypothetical protein